jgi:8-oxo-dGTP pyrophosphatase MutT (NUDIX family)
MQPGRAILKYFTESDLRPISANRQSQSEGKQVLSQAELEDIQAFAQNFSQTGEAVFSRSSLTRKAYLRVFISMLQSLGAVRVDETGQRLTIRPTGRLSRHLPEIWSMYLADSLTLVDNWNHVHLVPEDGLSAMELLRQMELRRIELTRRSGHTPKPLADRPVAFAVFHALDGKDKDCYLFEINKDWRRLNFIGGKQEKIDGGDFKETALREISEELGISRDRVTLTRLNDDPLQGYSLSGNGGSLASYPCVLFGATVAGPLEIRMQDRWVTESEVRCCLQMRDSPLMVNPVYLSYLLEGRPSRISRTPLSTDERVRSVELADLTGERDATLKRWARVLRENKDLLAAMITLLAAIISVVLVLK